MAYSVDWLAQEITIPVSDLTLVSGTEYELDMADFLIEIRRLESAFDEGLWAPQILEHTNPKLGFAGADYAGFDEVINSYSIIFGAGPTRVNISGSNNNILDVLIPTGISVASFNSAGKQIIVESSLDTTQDLYLTKLYQAHYNRRNHNKVANTITIYAADNITPLYVFDAPDDLTDITPQ